MASQPGTGSEPLTAAAQPSWAPAKIDEHRQPASADSKDAALSGTYTGAGYDDDYAMGAAEAANEGGMDGPSGYAEEPGDGAELPPPDKAPQYGGSPQAGEVQTGKTIWQEFQLKRDLKASATVSQVFVVLLVLVSILWVATFITRSVPFYAFLINAEGLPLIAMLLITFAVASAASSTACIRTKRWRCFRQCFGRLASVIAGLSVLAVYSNLLFHPATIALSLGMSLTDAYGLAIGAFGPDPNNEVQVALAGDVTTAFELRDRTHGAAFPMVAFAVIMPFLMRMVIVRRVDFLLFFGTAGLGIGFLVLFRLLVLTPELGGPDPNLPNDSISERMGFRLFLISFFHLVLCMGLSHVVSLSLVVQREEGAWFGFVQRKRLQLQAIRAEELLTLAMPRQIAHRLMAGELDRRFYESASVGFIYIAGYKDLVYEAQDDLLGLVDDLHQLYCRFDALVLQHDAVYKIESVANCYMVAAGIPDPCEDHAAALLRFCLAALELCRHLRHADPDLDWRLKIGIHSGSVTSGVVGLSRTFYRLFGDTVNTASRMGTRGAADRVNISRATYEMLGEPPVINPDEHDEGGPLYGADGEELGRHFVFGKVNGDLSLLVLPPEEMLLDMGRSERGSRDFGSDSSSDESEQVPLLGYTVEARGEIPVKGKGMMKTYFVDLPPSLWDDEDEEDDEDLDIDDDDGSFAGPFDVLEQAQSSGSDGAEEISPAASSARSGGRLRAGQQASDSFFVVSPSAHDMTATVPSALTHGSGLTAAAAAGSGSSMPAGGSGIRGTQSTAGSSTGAAEGRGGSGSIVRAGSSGVDVSPNRMPGRAESNTSRGSRSRRGSSSVPAGHRTRSTRRLGPRGTSGAAGQRGGYDPSSLVIGGASSGGPVTSGGGMMSPGQEMAQMRTAAARMLGGRGSGSVHHSDDSGSQPGSPRGGRSQPQGQNGLGLALGPTMQALSALARMRRNRRGSTRNRAGGLLSNGPPSVTGIASPAGGAGGFSPAGRPHYASSDAPRQASSRGYTGFLELPDLPSLASDGSPQAGAPSAGGKSARSSVRGRRRSGARAGSNRAPMAGGFTAGALSSERGDGRLTSSQQRSRSQPRVRGGGGFGAVGDTAGGGGRHLGSSSTMLLDVDAANPASSTAMLLRQARHSQRASIHGSLTPSRASAGSRGNFFDQIAQTQTATAPAPASGDNMSVSRGPGNSTSPPAATAGAGLGSQLRHARSSRRSSTRRGRSQGPRAYNPFAPVDMDQSPDQTADDEEKQDAMRRRPSFMVPTLLQGGEGSLQSTASFRVRNRGHGRQTSADKPSSTLKPSQSGSGNSRRKFRPSRSHDPTAGGSMEARSPENVPQGSGSGVAPAVNTARSGSFSPAQAFSSAVEVGPARGSADSNSSSGSALSPPRHTKVSRGGIPNRDMPSHSDVTDTHTPAAPRGRNLYRPQAVETGATPTSGQRETGKMAVAGARPRPKGRLQGLLSESKDGSSGDEQVSDSGKAKHGRQGMPAGRDGALRAMAEQNKQARLLALSPRAIQRAALKGDPRARWARRNSDGGALLTSAQVEAALEEARGLLGTAQIGGGDAVESSAAQPVETKQRFGGSRLKDLQGDTAPIHETGPVTPGKGGAQQSAVTNVKSGSISPRNAAGSSLSKSRDHHSQSTTPADGQASRSTGDQKAADGDSRSRRRGSVIAPAGKAGRTPFARSGSLSHALGSSEDGKGSTARGAVLLARVRGSKMQAAGVAGVRSGRSSHVSGMSVDDASEGQRGHARRFSDSSAASHSQAPSFRGLVGEDGPSPRAHGGGDQQASRPSASKLDRAASTVSDGDPTATDAAQAGKSSSSKVQPTFTITADQLSSPVNSAMPRRAIPLIGEAKHRGREARRRSQEKLADAQKAAAEARAAVERSRRDGVVAQEALAAAQAAEVALKQAEQEAEEAAAEPFSSSAPQIGPDGRVVVPGKGGRNSGAEDDDPVPRDRRHSGAAAQAAEVALKQAEQEAEEAAAEPFSSSAPQIGPDGRVVVPGKGGRNSGAEDDDPVPRDRRHSGAAGAAQVAGAASALSRSRVATATSSSGAGGRITGGHMSSDADGDDTTAWRQPRRGSQPFPAAVRLARIKRLMAVKRQLKRIRKQKRRDKAAAAAAAAPAEGSTGAEGITGAALAAKAVDEAGVALRAREAGTNGLEYDSESKMAPISTGRGSLAGTVDMTGGGGGDEHASTRDSGALAAVTSGRTRVTQSQALGRPGNSESGSRSPVGGDSRNGSVTGAATSRSQRHPAVITINSTNSVNGSSLGGVQSARPSAASGGSMGTPSSSRRRRRRSSAVAQSFGVEAPTAEEAVRAMMILSSAASGVPSHDSTLAPSEPRHTPPGRSASRAGGSSSKKPIQPRIHVLKRGGGSASGRGSDDQGRRRVLAVPLGSSEEGFSASRSPGGASGARSGSPAGNGVVSGFASMLRSVGGTKRSLQQPPETEKAGVNTFGRLASQSPSTATKRSSISRTKSSGTGAGSKAKPQSRDTGRGRARREAGWSSSSSSSGGDATPSRKRSGRKRGSKGSGESKMRDQDSTRDDDDDEDDDLDSVSSDAHGGAERRHGGARLRATGSKGAVSREGRGFAVNPRTKDAADRALAAAGIMTKGSRGGGGGAAGGGGAGKKDSAAASIQRMLRGTPKANGRRRRSSNIELPGENPGLGFAATATLVQQGRRIASSKRTSAASVAASAATRDRGGLGSNALRSVDFEPESVGGRGSIGADGSSKHAGASRSAKARKARSSRRVGGSSNARPARDSAGEDEEDDDDKHDDEDDEDRQDDGDEGGKGDDGRPVGDGQLETAQGFRAAQMLSRVAGQLLEVPPDQALYMYKFMSDPVTARCTNHFIHTMEAAYLRRYLDRARKRRREIRAKAKKDRSERRAQRRRAEDMGVAPPGGMFGWMRRSNGAASGGGAPMGHGTAPVAVSAHYTGNDRGARGGGWVAGGPDVLTHPGTAHGTAGRHTGPDAGAGGPQESALTAGAGARGQTQQSAGWFGQSPARVAPMPPGHSQHGSIATAALAAGGGAGSTAAAAETSGVTAGASQASNSSRARDSARRSNRRSGGYGRVRSVEDDDESQSSGSRPSTRTGPSAGRDGRGRDMDGGSGNNMRVGRGGKGRRRSRASDGNRSSSSDDDDLETQGDVAFRALTQPAHMLKKTLHKRRASQLGLGPGMGLMQPKRTGSKSSIHPTGSTSGGGSGNFSSVSPRVIPSANTPLLNVTPIRSSAPPPDSGSHATPQDAMDALFGGTRRDPSSPTTGKPPPPPRNSSAGATDPERRTSSVTPRNVSGQKSLRGGVLAPAAPPRKSSGQAVQSTSKDASQHTNKTGAVVGPDGSHARPPLVVVAGTSDKMVGAMSRRGGGAGAVDVSAIASGSSGTGRDSVRSQSSADTGRGRSRRALSQHDGRTSARAGTGEADRPESVSRRFDVSSRRLGEERSSLSGGRSPARALPGSPVPGRAAAMSSDGAHFGGGGPGLLAGGRPGAGRIAATANTSDTHATTGMSVRRGGGGGAAAAVRGRGLAHGSVTSTGAHPASHSQSMRMSAADARLALKHAQQEMSLQTQKVRRAMSFNPDAAGPVRKMSKHNVKSVKARAGATSPSGRAGAVSPTGRAGDFGLGDASAPTVPPSPSRGKASHRTRRVRKKDGSPHASSGVNFGFGASKLASAMLASQTAGNATLSGDRTASATVAEGTYTTMPGTVGGGPSSESESSAGHRRPGASVRGKLVRGGPGQSGSSSAVTSGDVARRALAGQGDKGAHSSSFSLRRGLGNFFRGRGGGDASGEVKESSGHRRSTDDGTDGDGTASLGNSGVGSGAATVSVMGGTGRHKFASSKQTPLTRSRGADKSVKDLRSLLEFEESDVQQFGASRKRSSGDQQRPHPAVGSVAGSAVSRSGGASSASRVAADSGGSSSGMIRVAAGRKPDSRHTRAASAASSSGDGSKPGLPGAVGISDDESDLGSSIGDLPAVGSSTGRGAFLGASRLATVDESNAPNAARRGVGASGRTASSGGMLAGWRTTRAKSRKLVMDSKAASNNPSVTASAAGSKTRALSAHHLAMAAGPRRGGGGGAELETAGAGLKRHGSGLGMLSAASMWARSTANRNPRRSDLESLGELADEDVAVSSSARSRGGRGGGRGRDRDRGHSSTAGHRDWETKRRGADPVDDGMDLESVAGSLMMDRAGDELSSSSDGTSFTTVNGPDDGRDDSFLGPTPGHPRAGEWTMSSGLTTGRTDMGSKKGSFQSAMSGGGAGGGRGRSKRQLEAPQTAMTGQPRRLKDTASWRTTGGISDMASLQNKGFGFGSARLDSGLVVLRPKRQTENGRTSAGGDGPRSGSAEFAQPRAGVLSGRTDRGQAHLSGSKRRLTGDDGTMEASTWAQHSKERGWAGSAPSIPGHTSLDSHGAAIVRTNHDTGAPRLSAGGLASAPDELIMGTSSLGHKVGSAVVPLHVAQSAPTSSDQAALVPAHPGMLGHSTKAMSGLPMEAIGGGHPGGIFTPPELARQPSDVSKASLAGHRGRSKRHRRRRAKQGLCNWLCCGQCRCARRCRRRVRRFAKHKYREMEEVYWNLDARFDDAHTEAVFQALRLRRVYRSVQQVINWVVLLTITFLAIAAMVLQASPLTLIPLITGVTTVLALLRIVQKHSSEFADDGHKPGCCGAYSSRAASRGQVAVSNTEGDAGAATGGGVDDELENAIAGAATGSADLDEEAAETELGPLESAAHLGSLVSQDALTRREDGTVVFPPQQAGFMAGPPSMQPLGSQGTSPPVMFAPRPSHGVGPIDSTGQQSSLPGVSTVGSSNGLAPPAGGIFAQDSLGVSAHSHSVAGSADVAGPSSGGGSQADVAVGTRQPFAGSSPKSQPMASIAGASRPQIDTDGAVVSNGWESSGDSHTRQSASGVGSSSNESRAFGAPPSVDALNTSSGSAWASRGVAPMALQLTAGPAPRHNDADLTTAYTHADAVGGRYGRSDSFDTPASAHAAISDATSMRQSPGVAGLSNTSSGGGPPMILAPSSSFTSATNGLGTAPSPGIAGGRPRAPSAHQLPPMAGGASPAALPRSGSAAGQYTGPTVAPSMEHAGPVTMPAQALAVAMRRAVSTPVGPGAQPQTGLPPAMGKAATSTMYTSPTRGGPRASRRNRKSSIVGASPRQQASRRNLAGNPRSSAASNSSFAGQQFAGSASGGVQRFNSAGLGSLQLDAGLDSAARGARGYTVDAEKMSHLIDASALTLESTTKRSTALRARARGGKKGLKARRPTQEGSVYESSGGGSDTEKKLRRHGSKQSTPGGARSVKSPSSVQGDIGDRGLPNSGSRSGMRLRGSSMPDASASPTAASPAMTPVSSPRRDNSSVTSSVASNAGKTGSHQTKPASTTSRQAQSSPRSSAQGAENASPNRRGTARKMLAAQQRKKNAARQSMIGPADTAIAWSPSGSKRRLNLGAAQTAAAALRDAASGELRTHPGVPLSPTSNDRPLVIGTASSRRFAFDGAADAASDGEGGGGASPSSSRSHSRRRQVLGGVGSNPRLIPPEGVASAQSSGVSPRLRTATNLSPTPSSKPPPAGFTPSRSAHKIVPSAKEDSASKRLGDGSGMKRRTSTAPPGSNAFAEARTSRTSDPPATPVGSIALSRRITAQGGQPPIPASASSGSHAGATNSTATTNKPSINGSLPTAPGDAAVQPFLASAAVVSGGASISGFGTTASSPSPTGVASQHAGAPVSTTGSQSQAFGFDGGSSAGSPREGDGKTFNDDTSAPSGHSQGSHQARPSSVQEFLEAKADPFESDFEPGQLAPPAPLSSAPGAVGQWPGSMTQEQMQQHLQHEEQLRLASERAQAESVAAAVTQFADAMSPGVAEETAMSEAAAAGHGVPPLPTRGSAGHGSVSRMRTINDSAIRRAQERKERECGQGCYNWRTSCVIGAAKCLSRVPGCGNRLEADTVIAGLLFLLHTAICAAFAAKYVLGAPDLAGMKAALSDGLQDPRVGGSGTPEEASLIEFQAACAQSSFVPLVVLFTLPVLPLGPGAMFTLCLLGAFFVIGARASNGLIDECLPAEFAITTVALFLPMVFAVFDARGQEAQKRRALLQRLASRRAKTQADSVLEQLLPTHVNEKLRRNEPVPFEIHPNHVVMIWADLVGFTALSATLEPEQVMTILNALYSRFDALVERANLWKVDTIGDAYVIIGGLVDIKSGGKAKAADLPGPELVERMFKVATSMRQQVRAVSTATGQDIGIRIGIHSGPVATGIIGTLRPRWHVFGPTVLEAEHMESEGRRSWIQVSEAAFRLYNMRGFSLVERVRHPEAVVEVDSEYLREIGQPIPQRPPPRVSLLPVDPKKLTGPLPAWLDEQEASEAALEAREAEAAAANGGRQWAKPSRNDGDGALWAFWLHPNDVSGQGHMQDSFVQQNAPMGMQGATAGGSQFGRRRNSLQMRPGMFADLLALPPYLADTVPPLDPATTVLPGTQPMLSQSPSKPQTTASGVVIEAESDVATAAIGSGGQSHHTQLRPAPIQTGASLSSSALPSATDASVDVFRLAAEASTSTGEPSPAEPAARAVQGGAEPNTAAPPVVGSTRNEGSGLVLTAEQLAAAAAGRPVELSTDQTVRAAAVASRRPSWRGFEQLRTRDDDDRDDTQLTRDEDRRWAKEHSGADTGRSRKELKPRMSRARMFLSQGPLANVAPGHVLDAALGNGAGDAPGATVQA